MSNLLTIFHYTDLVQHKISLCLFFVRGKPFRNIFSNVQRDATFIAVGIWPIRVLNPSITKLPTGKLLWIFVSEAIKTSILPFTWVETLDFISNGICIYISKNKLVCIFSTPCKRYLHKKCLEKTPRLQLGQPGTLVSWDGFNFRFRLQGWIYHVVLFWV